MKLVMLGPPGSGKGTQAALLEKNLMIPHISTGDLLRHAIRTETELGIQAKEFINKGDLVPDAVVDGMISQRINEQDCRRGFILDGYPRNLSQSRFLAGATKLHSVIYVDCPDDTIIERLSARRVCDCGESYNLIYNPPKAEGICDKCGRSLYQRKDDVPATIGNRIRSYHLQTEPVIKFYENQGILERVNGTHSIDDVHTEIVRRIQRPGD